MEHISQNLNVLEKQVVNEHTSSFASSEKPSVMAESSHEELKISSKKSFERVSPEKQDEEVMTCIFIPLISTILLFGKK